MLHETYRDLLQQYIDGEIDPLVKMLLEEHLSSCRTCRRELNQLKLLDWELKHQSAVELPVELAAYRMSAVKTHLATSTAQTPSVSVWRLQRQILHHSSSFLGLNPLNRTLSWAAKATLSKLGKVAGTALKKRNPLLARLIPGRA